MVAVDLMPILPRYFRPVIEFQEIANAHGWAMDGLEHNIDQVGANCFIQTADEGTIAYYEELMGLTYTPGETLEFRRQRVLQELNAVVPFSIGFLRARLTELFGDGYTLVVDSAACTLTITVESGRFGALDLLYSLLWSVLPAHLEIIASQEVSSNLLAPLHVTETMSVTHVKTI